MPTAKLQLSRDISFSAAEFTVNEILHGLQFLGIFAHVKSSP